LKLVAKPPFEKKNKKSEKDFFSVGAWEKARHKQKKQCWG